jgi:N-dimethylarginine dimethylaminohydrolase
MVRNEGDKLRRVVVAAPRREYFQVEKPEAHNIEEVADKARAVEQHQQLRTILRRAGARVINLPELAGHPNSVFTRDTGLVTPGGYIKSASSPAASSGWVSRLEHWICRLLICTSAAP